MRRRSSGMADLLLEIGCAPQGVRRPRRGQRRRLHDPARVDRQPDRAERRRQDDVLQHDHGRLQADVGRVVFDGEDIAGKPPHAATERGIGRTFQNIRLFQQMTSLENVLVGMHCRLQGRHRRRASSGTPASGARSVRRVSEPASCSTTAASPAITTTTRATSRTATSGGSRSRARSPRSPSCCSSTSRLPG